MNLFADAAEFTTSRAFSEDFGYNPARDSLASVLLRVTGTFGGGVAVTVLLAVLLHH